MKAILKVLLFVGALIPSAVSAQDYPTRRMSIIVPFTPGGSNDAVGRYLADGLGKLWKQTIIVENRPGGGSSIGSAYVAKSPPDGYRLLLVSSSYATNAATRTDQGFDAVKDLKPVSMVGRGQVGVVTGSRVPMPTIADLARESKAQTIFFATAGVGSTQHLNGELLNTAMGIKMTAVPYTGGTEGLRDLLGGRVDVVAGALPGLISTIDGGAKLIAVLGRERSRSFPDVPTMIEAGYPKAVTEVYYGIFAPAGTPAAIVGKIHQGITTVTHAPEGRAYLAKLDMEPTTLSPDEFTTYVRNEIDDWTSLVKQLNLSAP